MGKSPKKRTSKRHNPVRVPDSHLGHGLNAATTASPGRAKEVLPILQKLESPDTADRTWACAAVTNLIQNDPSTRRLLQGNNVVGALITRLSDSADDVVVEASGALRNLCIDGGYEICAEMYNKNILSPIRALIPKISNIVTQILANPDHKPSASEGLQKRVYELAENAITVFWCLSETSNKALNAVNNVDLIPFLMAFLTHRDKIPIKAVLAAAQCLYVLSDDNEPAIQTIRKSQEYISCLMTITKSPDVMLNGQQNSMTVDPSPIEDDKVLFTRVLACGVLKNISPIPVVVPAPPIDLDTTVALPLLLPLLSFDLQEVALTVQNLTSNPLSEHQEKHIKHAPKSDHKTSTELELERIETRLRTVQLALEILTSICAQLPDPEPGIIEGEDDDDDDETIEDDGDEDPIAVDEDDTIIDDGTELPLGLVPKATANSLLSSLTQPLLNLARPTQLSFPPPSSQTIHPPTTSALGTVHVRALECLNNLFLSVNSHCLPEGAQQAVEGVWADVWGILGLVGEETEWMVGRGQERRKDMWDVGVGVLWGLAQLGVGTLVPHVEQVAALVKYCDATKDEQTKVKCIGTLGCLAQKPDAIEPNNMISTYLFRYLSSSPPTPQPEPILHAVSVIIDIYSDETKPYDSNFRQQGWLGVLASSKEGIKRVVKSIDRRKEGGREARAFGDEVLANLIAFVSYRKKLKL